MPIPLLISGATIIDGVAGEPLEGQAIWMESGRIKAIGRRDEFAKRPGAEILDAEGQYVIPGLIDTNVHLAGTLLLEEFARFEDRYEDVIAESAQVALKNGLTTVCDTWGPRRALISVREKINSGEIPGSRILCAGNIIGLDGPFSENFFPKYRELASPAFAERINSTFSETVGPELTWMSPEQVAPIVRAYTGYGVDFIKYASSEHKVPSGPSAYLTFSPAVQTVIVQEAHRAGLTAQAHSTSVEALRIAVEAGCDIIQHANLTCTVPIPSATFQLMRERKTSCTILPFTKRERELVTEKGGPMLRRMYSPASTEVNVRNLIGSGISLLLATDSGYISREAMKAAAEGGLSSEESLYALGPGHFLWFKAMEEHGMNPMKALKAATHNIAVALRRDKDLGSLVQGKVADLILLEKNPLRSADNYRSIRAVLKDGMVVNRAALPLKPILRQ